MPSSKMSARPAGSTRSRRNTSTGISWRRRRSIRRPDSAGTRPAILQSCIEYTDTEQSLCPIAVRLMFRHQRGSRLYAAGSLRGCAFGSPSVKCGSWNEYRQKKARKPRTRRSFRALAEKEGFEPSRQLSHPTPLAGEPLRPLGYFSTITKLAEREGFEPPVPFGITGFQDQRLKPLGHLS